MGERSINGIEVSHTFQIHAQRHKCCFGLNPAACAHVVARKDWVGQVRTPAFGDESNMCVHAPLCHQGQRAAAPKGFVIRVGCDNENRGQQAWVERAASKS